MEGKKVFINVRYSPTCKVCRSKYLEDIHNMRLEGKKYEEIIEFLKSKGVTKKEELPNAPNLSRHFKYHFVIPNIKKKAILARVSSKIIPTLATIPSQSVEGLLEKDIDYIGSLKTLLVKQLSLLSEITERLEESFSLEKEEKEINFTEEIELYKLIQSLVKDVANLLEKIDKKQEGYKDVSILKDFVISLVGLINDLETRSNEKELISNFRIQVASLVKRFEF